MSTHRESSCFLVILCSLDYVGGKVLLVPQHRPDLQCVLDWEVTFPKRLRKSSAFQTGFEAEGSQHGELTSRPGQRAKLLSKHHPQPLPGLREGEALPWRPGGAGLQLCFCPSCLLRKVATLVHESVISAQLKPRPPWGLWGSESCV